MIALQIAFAIAGTMSTIAATALMIALCRVAAQSAALAVADDDDEGAVK